MTTRAISPVEPLLDHSVSDLKIIPLGGILIADTRPSGPAFGYGSFSQTRI
jgi:hypothetical protein